MKHNYKNTIAYEHDKLKKCNNNCSACESSDFGFCESKCCPKYFEELKNYCTRDNLDCGFIYEYKEQIIKFDKYTGILQLSDGSYLEILPKICKTCSIGESRRILENLILASHNLTKEYKDNNQTSVETIKENQVLEIFISDFCLGLNTILKRGLKKSYVRKCENLKVYKGKLNFSKHVIQNISTKNKFFVDYSEFSFDIPENRILKSACSYIVQHSQSDFNKNILRRFLVELSDVSLCENLEKDLQNVQLNRLHSYYQRPLQYAEFFLRKKSFYPKIGRHALPALLFPLNEMFEDYIENILKSNSISVHSQYRPHYLIFSENTNLFNTKMDFVIKSENTAILMDAKWKQVDISVSNLNVSQADLYQLFTYSEILKTEEKLNKVIILLLYPKTNKFNRIISSWKFFNGTEIMAVPIDVLNKDNNIDFINLINKKGNSK